MQWSGAGAAAARNRRLLVRAVVMRAFGDPDVLSVEDAPRPVPLLTEVLIRVVAVGVNPVDAYVRSGAFPIARPPVILGWDVSGVVEAVEPGVTRFRPGDAVFGMPLFPRVAGCYAEYVAAPARQLARQPAAIDHAQAAGLSLAGLTAWQALVDIADVRPGQRVLIHAAAGGVGHLAVQLAKARGAHVTGTARAGKHDFVRSVGADEVIDYRTVDFANVARDIDVVLDLVGGDNAVRSVAVLRPGGLLVSVDRTNADAAVRAVATGRRFTGIAVEPDRVGLERLAQLVDEGKVRVHVGQVLALEEAARAHALLARGGTPGKVVLKV